jgi:2-polyprenyl-6-methoxyphenol hydroxylase-like FAD-dependent oxidoreductase
MGDFDAIIIGSGMGGMSCAAALSRVGRKVLMLDQFTTLGGQTHSFARHGFQWDAGPDMERRKISGHLPSAATVFRSQPGTTFGIRTSADASWLSPRAS